MFQLWPRWFLSLCLLVLWASPISNADAPANPPSSGASGKALIDEANILYAKRHNPPEVGKPSLEEAIKKYEAALAATPTANKPEVVNLCMRLSKAYYNLADQFLTKDGDKLNAYDKGASYADNAIAIDPGCGEAYYWRAVDVGLYRDIRKLSTRGGLTGGGIKRDFEEASRLDERCVYGGPHRGLAEFALARGNSKEALLQAEKAVQIEPRFLWNLDLLGKILWRQGQKDKAKAILEQIASQKEDVLPEELTENRQAIEKAKRLLNELKQKKEIQWD